jgi:hypothetical protein
MQAEAGIEEELKEFFYNFKRTKKQFTFTLLLSCVSLHPITKFSEILLKLKYQLSLKVHKQEIILNFFLDLNQILISPFKFSKKIALLFLRFSPEFRCSNISAVTEHTRNQISFERYPKNFFFKIFTLVLSDRLLERFFKILVFYRRNLHFN